MRKLFIITSMIIFLLMAGIAGAAPFLVCDPPDPADQVIYYIVYQDGVEIFRATIENGAVRADGSLGMDLQAITPGAYTWTVRAGNVWEESGLSDPYISPSGAGVPQNTRMEP